MIKEFKEFINRGNVVDLAVAVVVGAAFGAVVASFSTDIIGGILSMIGGKPDLSQSFVVTVNNGQVRFGSFLTAIINFLIVAFAVFLVVKAVNRVQNLRSKEEEEALEATEVELLTEIRDLLRARG